MTVPVIVHSPAAAEIERVGWTEALHPRSGGKFAKKGTSPAASKSDSQSLRFDGKRGAGYGHKGGDNRVHALQSELNRLGLADGSGKKLAIDGKLGPKTTAAIKRAQRALGMKADGVATPALLAKLKSTKGLKAKHAAAAKTPHAHKAPAHKPAAHKAAPTKKTAPPATNATGRKSTYFATATKNKKV